MSLTHVPFSLSPCSTADLGVCISLAGACNTRLLASAPPAWVPHTGTGAIFECVHVSVPCRVPHCSSLTWGPARSTAPAWPTEGVASVLFCPSHPTQHFCGLCAGLCLREPRLPAWAQVLPPSGQSSTPHSQALQPGLLAVFLPILCFQIGAAHVLSIAHPNAHLRAWQTLKAAWPLALSWVHPVGMTGRTLEECLRARKDRE